MSDPQGWVLLGILGVALTALVATLNYRVGDLGQRIDAQSSLLSKRIDDVVGGLAEVERVLRTLVDDMATVKATQVLFNERLSKIEERLP